MRCFAIPARLGGLLAFAVLPGALDAQATPYRIAAGDVVRFRVAEREGRVVGRVASVTPDTLWLESRPTWVRSGFARDEVRQLERRVSGPSGAGTGLLVGLGFGAGVGVVWGSLACGYLEGCSARVPLALGAMLGGVGALAGGFIGAIGSPATWSIAICPTAAGFGASLGVRLTFPL